jgi:hypothetical protein
MIEALELTLNQPLRKTKSSSYVSRLFNLQVWWLWLEHSFTSILIHVTKIPEEMFGKLNVEDSVDE